MGTETITTEFLSHNGKKYEVTVTYGPEAKIPEGSTLSVTDIEEGTDEYEYARNAVLADRKEKGEFVDIKDFNLAALDISIIDPNGKEIEPEATVQVDIKIKDLPGVENLDEIKDSLEIQHHVEVTDGVVVEKVFDGSEEGTFQMDTNETVAEKGTAVDPNSVSDEDFKIEVNPTDESEVNFDEIGGIDASFDTPEFSTFTITWEGGASNTTNTTGTIRWRYSRGTYRIATVHYVDTSGNPITRPSGIYNNYGNYDVAMSGNSYTGTATFSNLVGTISGYTLSGIYRDSSFEHSVSSVTYSYYDGTSYSDGYNPRNGNLDIYIVYSSETAGNKATVHYGYMNGSTFIELDEKPSPTTVTTNNPAYLIYDFEGYQYSGYTYYRTSASNTPATGGIRIQAQLRYSSGSWSYHEYSTEDSNRNWNSLANNSHVYVVYNQKPAAEAGGTAQIDDIASSDWPQGSDTPLFSKSSTNNGDGTNTVSLSISGGEKDYEKSTKANVIVVFDVSGSMSTNLNGQTRLARAKTAVNNMANTLLKGDIDGVKMALISFSTTSSATPVQGFTDNYYTYRNAVNGLTADGGTNWEQALYNANRLEVDDDAATFVVFVTDGDPTYRLSRYNAPDSEVQGYNRDNRYFEYNIFGEGDDDTNNRNFNAAADEVKSILANNKTFYAIGVSADVTKVQNLVNTAGGGTAYLATDDHALTEAFANITQSIKTTLGFGDVAITDGITELANVEMKVMQEVDPDSFTYYKTTSSGRTEWNPASEGAGLASYDKTTGAVTWDIGEGFQLEKGVTYEVTFRVWPSQEAYDLIADLNNGVKVYASGSENSITDDERKQIVEIAAPTATQQGSYTLKTNTDPVDATYSQTSSTGGTVTVSGDTAIHARCQEGTIENMALTSQLLTIKKIFDQSLDPKTVQSVTLKLQRKVNDNDHTMADYNVPGTTSPNIVLSKSNNWETSFYVAPGFIVDGETLEKGYKFTVTEPDLGENTVRYDLIPEIVNPMVVDGRLQLIGDGDGNQQLTAINRTRSAIEIHKTLYDIDGTTQIYPDTEFTITGKLLGPDGTPFTSQEVAAPVAYYLYDKDGNATTERMHFADSSNISFKLKAGEFIRFVNVPEGCTFEFTEGSMPNNYQFNSLGAVGRQRAESDPPYTYSIELSDEAAHLVEGASTISTTSAGIIGNTNYKLDFYNKRTTPLPNVDLLKVDASDNTLKLNDAEFELHKDSAEGEVITLDGNGKTIAIKTGNKTDSTGPDGWYNIGYLPAGTYYLVETAAPANHELDTTPVIITVTKETNSYTVTATKDGTSVISGPTDGTYTITVDNELSSRNVTILKTTESGKSHPLAGAIFDLYTKEGYEANPRADAIQTGIESSAVEGKTGQLALGQLTYGDYILVERDAPDGYNLLDSTIALHVEKDKISVIQGSSQRNDTTPDDDDFDAFITNTSGVELPHTGGSGTLPYSNFPLEKCCNSRWFLAQQVIF